MMKELLVFAERAGQRLKEREETIAVAESSSGGLLSAALLSVPGASAYFRGGAVVYTGKSREVFLSLKRADVSGMRSASEAYAMLLARTVRERFGSNWALSESGAAGPTGNPYGDPPGHTCIAISGPVEKAITVETRSDNRVANMKAFASEALELLLRGLSEAPT